MAYLIKTIDYFRSNFKSDGGSERSIVNQLFVELLTPALPSYEYGILLLQVGVKPVSMLVYIFVIGNSW